MTAREVLAALCPRVPTAAPCAHCIAEADKELEALEAAGYRIVRQKQIGEDHAHKDGVDYIACGRGRCPYYPLWMDTEETP